MSTLPLHNEKQLLHAIANGDGIAFGQLYEHYRRKVYFIALRLLHSENEAEDVQQEIFTKLWVHRSKLAEVEQFNSYLNTLIRNYIYNALRKKANEIAYIRESFIRAEHEIEDAFQHSDINELQGLLHQAINNLPRQQKKVFQLVRMEGRPHAEVADLLGISKGTVKKHIMEAQRNIADFFRNMGKDALLILLMLSFY